MPPSLLEKLFLDILHPTMSDAASTLLKDVCKELDATIAKEGGSVIGSNVSVDSNVKKSGLSVLRTPTSYVMYLDVPGMQKTEVKVFLQKLNQQNVVCIQGQRVKQTAPEGSTFLHMPMVAVNGDIDETFTLPSDADTEDMTATIVNGVLEVCVKRSSVSDNVKCVPIT